MITVMKWMQHLFFLAPKQIFTSLLLTLVDNEIMEGHKTESKILLTTEIKDLQKFGCLLKSYTNKQLTLKRRKMGREDTSEGGVPKKSRTLAANYRNLINVIKGALSDRAAE
jgi:hypothetical protein